ncbi:MAG: caspase family protein [Saprospiraceae bacterium]
MNHILSVFLIAFGVLNAAAQNEGPRLIVPLGHTTGITCVDISPNGRYFLTGSKDKTAKIWTLDGHEIHTLQGHLFEVHSVRFSPKCADDSVGGKYILTGGTDRKAILWDERGNMMRTIEDHTGYVSSVAFSPDAKYILTGSLDGTARLSNRSGGAIRTFSHKDKVRSVAFSPNGQSILTGCNDRTAVMWEISGTKFKAFSGHADEVLCAIFSPGGDSVLTGSADGTAKLWDLTGKVLRTFQHSNEVCSVDFLPDGQTVVTGSSDGTLKVWNLSEKEARSYKGFERGFGGLRVSPDGKLILLSSKEEPVAKLMTLDGQVLQKFKGHSSTITSMALAPNGVSLLTGHADSTVKIWTALGQEVRTFKYPDKIVSVAFSPISPDDSVGGKFILTGCEDNIVRLHDLAGREKCRFGSANRAAFSPDGKSVATSNADGITKLWRLASMQSLTFQNSENVTALDFAPDGKSIVIGTKNGMVVQWDTSGRELLKFHLSSTLPVNSIAFSPDSKSIVTASQSGLTQTRTLAGGLSRTYENKRGSVRSVRSVAFSPRTPEDPNGGKYVLIGCGDDIAELWDYSNNTIKTFSRHTSAVSAALFSPEGKYILTGGKDSTVKLWDAQSAKELAMLIALDSSDWVVLHPSGLFDASPGAMHLMYYVYDDELLEFKQLKTRYHEPYLFQKIVGIKPGGLRPVNEMGDVKLYPEVCEWAIKDDLLSVLLTPRNGGIGRSALLLDGRELLADANPARKPSFTVDLKQFAGFYAAEAPNQLNLILHNKGGDLPSQPFLLEASNNTYNHYGVTAKNPNQPDDAPKKSLNEDADKALENIHLYALVIGTSIYRDEKLKLTYPEKDAAIFADALEKSGKELFKERTVVKLLSTADADPKKWPRKAEIRKAVQDIAAKAGPDDILLIYFSGHGLTYKAPNSEESQFYYLTTDIAGDNLRDEGILNAQAIAQDSLMDWVRKVKTRKRILIYDACNSGSVVEKMEGAKDLTSDQRKALERINERSGMFVLTGSAADKSSYEANTYGHGLLTYSLLNGMLAVAAENDDGNVELGNLFDFVENDVRELAKRIDREQRPEVIKAESYPIGQIKANTGIKRPSELDVFVRTNLNVSKEGVDLHDVSKAVNAELEKLAAEQKPTLVFWGDVSSFSGKYYLIGGEYQEVGEKITGTANLYQGRTKLTSFPIEGKKANLSKMAKTLVFDVQEYLMKNPPK